MERTRTRRPFARLAVFRRAERGQSIVEFALSLPILIFALLGGADMARAYAAQLAVQNGARAGAEGVALQYSPVAAEAAEHARGEMSHTPGMNVGSACTGSGNNYTCGAATITVRFVKDNGNGLCNGAANDLAPGQSTIESPCYAKVRVRYTYSTIVAWPVVPNTFQLDRTTYVRRYQQ